MSRILVLFVALLGILGSVLVVGCSSAPRTRTEVSILEEKAEVTVASIRRLDPSLDRFFEDSYGWAIFPTIGKGAIGVGGAHGEGVVYRNGEAIGTASMTQATIGLQLGGQSYSEVIFFQRSEDLKDFLHGQLEFDAQASAVAADAGAGASADYHKGVAIFTMGERGLMAEASIGGQKFSYVPN